VKRGSACSDRDLVRGWSAFALWCVPTVLIVIGAFLPNARALLWIPSFLVMGVACIVNARGCGRLHCYVTGPVFLLGALASALDALAMLAVAWWLVLVAVALGTLLGYSLEWIRGKYIETSSST
jgi:hypothetical protein